MSQNIFRATNQFNLDHRDSVQSAATLAQITTTHVMLMDGKHKRGLALHRASSNRLSDDPIMSIGDLVVEISITYPNRVLYNMELALHGEDT